MAKVGKIIAVAALTAVTIATGGAAGIAIGFSWSTFAGSLILGGLSYALSPKPKSAAMDSSIENKGQTVAVRQSDLTRQNVYGHTRITRGYAQMESTGLNGKLHMMLILCEGPIRAINEIWVNDYVIPQDWIDEDGNVTQGRYAGYMTIRKHLGAFDQTADTVAVANMTGWTTDHRLQGIAYVYITMTKNQDVYPTGVPNMTAIVEGQENYDPRTGDFSWNTNIALYCRDFMTSDLYGFAAKDDEIDDVNIAAQANICDEIVTTPDVDTTVSSVNATTNILTLSGDLLLYQYGDRIRFIGSDLPGGLSAGVDYYLIPYQVKTTPRIQVASSFDNAMAKVVIDITTTGSGSITVRKTGEPRYHGSGVVDSENALSNTLNDLSSCMAGRTINVGGDWTLLAGAWRTPEVTFGIGDIRGNGIGFKNCLSMSESYNIVKGLFISSLNLYQQSDYPSAVYQTFIEQDNGRESPRDMNLPYTNRPTTATRIAKIELFRGRQDIVYNSDFSMKALQVKPGDNIAFDVERLGWEGKEFEITEFGFDVADGNLVTRMTLRETAQAIFDWTAGEAITYDPAPNTNLPNPFDVQVPTGVAYNSRYIDTREGDAVYTMTLRWDVHPNQFVTNFGDFEVQYKLSEETEWRPSFTVPGSETKTDVVNSSVNVYYDLRIRARNNLGVRSPWVTILDAVVGSSGGVTETRDYEFVNDPIGTYLDYGSVADAVTDAEDWGFVE